MAMRLSSRRSSPVMRVSRAGALASESQEKFVRRWPSRAKLNQQTLVGRVLRVLVAIHAGPGL